MDSEQTCRKAHASLARFLCVSCGCMQLSLNERKMCFLFFTFPFFFYQTCKNGKQNTPNYHVYKARKWLCIFTTRSKLALATIEKGTINKINVVCTVDRSNGNEGGDRKYFHKKFLRIRMAGLYVVNWIESGPDKFYGYWVSWRAGKRFTDIRNNIFFWSETQTVGLSETIFLNLYILWPFVVPEYRNTNNC